MSEKVLQDIRCCDICNDPNAPYLCIFESHTIPAGIDADFAMEMIEHPEWFACERCHRLILASDVKAMVEVAIEGNKPAPEVTSNVRDKLTKIYTSLVANVRLH